MGDDSSLENIMRQENQMLKVPTLAVFMLFILIVAYTLYIFEVDKKYRKFGVISFVAYICSFYFFLAYSATQRLWEKGLYLPIPRPATIFLFLFLWAVGTLTLAVMISKMAKDSKHE